MIVLDRPIYLTTENASEYVGKTLDAKHHILGAYPYKVIQMPDGEYLAVGKAGEGVGEVVAKPNDLFNAIYFDIILD